MHHNVDAFISCHHLLHAIRIQSSLLMPLMPMLRIFQKQKHSSFNSTFFSPYNQKVIVNTHFVQCYRKPKPFSSQFSVCNLTLNKTFSKLISMLLLCCSPIFSLFSRTMREGFLKGKHYSGHNYMVLKQFILHLEMERVWNNHKSTPKTRTST